jgi:hypothetical protein
MIKIFENIAHVCKAVSVGVEQRLLDVAIEQDRTLQVLIWNDGVDWTISGVSNSDPHLIILKDLLNLILPGGPAGDHTQNAATDDNAQETALQSADPTAH